MSIKNIVKRVLFPNTYSSEAFVSYLKRMGVSIGEGCYFWSPNKTTIDTQRPSQLVIGNYVKFTEGVRVLSHDYSRSVVLQMGGGNIGEAARTVIGDNVFIGMDAIILMGAKIGANSVVGAGAVVSGEFPEGSVIAGNPAKAVSSITRFSEVRKSRETNAALQMGASFLQSYGRVPSINEMGGAFAWLYLPHTIEVWNENPSLFRYNGVDPEVAKQSFLGSTPHWESFDDFLSECKEYALSDVSFCRDSGDVSMERNR